MDEELIICIECGKPAEVFHDGLCENCYWAKVHSKTEEERQKLKIHLEFEQKKSKTVLGALGILNESTPVREMMEFDQTSAENLKVNVTRYSMNELKTSIAEQRRVIEVAKSYPARIEAMMNNMATQMLSPFADEGEEELLRGQLWKNNKVETKIATVREAIPYLRQILKVFEERLIEVETTAKSNVTQLTAEAKKAAENACKILKKITKVEADITKKIKNQPPDIKLIRGGAVLFSLYYAYQEEFNKAKAQLQAFNEPLNVEFPELPFVDSSISKLIESAR